MTSRCEFSSLHDEIIPRTTLREGKTKRFSVDVFGNDPDSFLVYKDSSWEGACSTLCSIDSIG